MFPEVEGDGWVTVWPKDGRPTVLTYAEVEAALEEGRRHAEFHHPPVIPGWLWHLPLR